ncbi:hypothetical protein [Spiroplasma endosymbiont of Cantharis lateralis]|uniref:hypothetical protein n=1 Tax=Spiroplasma endosymbiont of Cantharis lateralis TaxID=3066277 RepID=UPI00313DCE29
MNLLYNSITIINIDNKKEFFYQKFSKGFNFVRAENRAGKSTLAKSIFYSLGSAIDLDELEDEVKNLATILEFSICNEIYYIVSKIFDKRRTVYLFDSEMELLIQCNKNQKNKSNSNLVLNYEAFSNWVLDKLFNIGWIRFQEKYRSTELISPYLSSIFEFFYIDQSEWGIDFASFDDTQFIERKNLELLIGVFSNKFNENDFNILINSKNLEKKNQKLKLNKDIYKATIREINSRNNIEGFNDIETVNKMKRDFDKHYNDIKDQLKITNILKQKYFQKSLLSKIMSQYSSIKDNFIYMRDNLFPIELPIINSSGKVQKINFEDIISWKSNHELNIKNQKKLNKKLLFWIMKLLNMKIK